MSPDPLTVKFSRLFDLLDADGNGLIDHRDYDLVARRVAGSLGYPPASEATEDLVVRYRDAWRKNLDTMDIEYRGALTREVFVAALRNLVDCGPDAVTAVARVVADPFLQAADTDRDGRVSAEEFGVYAHGHLPSLSDADVRAAFARLDTDGDGYLSHEEIVAATVDFWTNTDPIPPGSWWRRPQP